MLEGAGLWGMSAESKSRDAIVIRYFRDITAILGVPVAVLVYRDNEEVEVHIRQDWQAVTAYDKDADLRFIQAFIQGNLPNFKKGIVGLAVLLSAENCIRADKLAGTDSDFDQKLADVIHGF